jgi:hypothetical protein
MFLDSFPIERLRMLGERPYLLGGPAGGDARQGEFPLGTWESVATAWAAQQESYTVAVPTLADSTEENGIAWSVHFVTTHTTTPSIWFASEPDSGYSTDDIAPGAPFGLRFGEPGLLEWGLAPEEDFQYHTVYGSDVPIFDATATVLGSVIDPAFDVAEESFPFFHVTTSDHAGNEGAASSIGNGTSGVEAGGGFVTELRAARPSPFRGTTEITFALAAARGVALAVYDASGRQVRSLAAGRFEAGAHTVVWDGRADSGQSVASGVYFARLEAGTFRANRRLVLTK